MCFLKKMFKPSLNSHWLNVINDAIQAADDKIAKAKAEKAEKADAATQDQPSTPETAPAKSEASAKTEGGDE